jgi:dUTP pyrophosphatase
MKIKIQKIHEDAKLPRKENKHDSGWDIFSVQDYIIKPNGRVKVSTGLIWEPQADYNEDFIIEAQVRAKSGLALNEGLSVLNGVGTVDMTYRDEICVLLYNTSRHEVKINKGQKIAQLVFQKLPIFTIEEGIIDLKHTINRKGGFGSTGLI